MHENVIQSTSKCCANVNAAACVVCADSVLLWTRTELSSTLVLLTVFKIQDSLITVLVFHTVECMFVNYYAI